MTRLPSFNDFSPGIIGDIRKALSPVAEHEGNFDAIVRAWLAEFFPGGAEKRARTNITATLVNTGLLDRSQARLTQVGRDIMEAPTAVAAAQNFVAHLIANRNGVALLDAVGQLHRRGERVTKDSLKAELRSLGVEGLAAGTTDHTTLANWMVEAGLLEPRPSYAHREEAIKLLLGISSGERSELLSLPLPQQIFLSVLRRVVEAEATHEVAARLITDECLRDYPTHFDDDQLSAKVTRPLEAAGWIEISGRSGRSSGGKAGNAKATDKLLAVPLEQIVPDFDAVVPADLRRRIDTPRDEIRRLLASESKNDRGLGLELLALRMLLDLNLQPRSFRQRARETAYAELDLTAEGVGLLFSRWNWQCKCVSERVPLGDVAKEVGLAIYSRSHVVAMVTTSDFSREALNYAREITRATHLQFVFINGTVIDAYLSRGPSSLVDFFMANASQVMKQKRQQAIAASNEDV